MSFVPHALLIPGNRRATASLVAALYVVPFVLVHMVDVLRARLMGARGGVEQILGVVSWGSSSAISVKLDLVLAWKHAGVSCFLRFLGPRRSITRCWPVSGRVRPKCGSLLVL